MFHLKLTALFAIYTVCSAFPGDRKTNLSDFFIHPNAQKAGVSPRIIGGEVASPHEFPYQVGLYCNTSSGGTEFCGGSLISNNYVLTAAHCVDSAVSVDIILGAHEITTVEASQVRQTSNEFAIHPDWNRNQLVNDIAVIRLKEPVVENDEIQIVKIARGSDLFAGSQGTITGWGRLANGQEGVTPILRFLVSDILSNEECRAIDPYDTVIQSTHLCLNGVYDNANVGTCNGDSGGPLTVDGIQVGLVSFGYKDCDVGKPSVFTRLTEFGDWLGQNTDVSF